MRISDWSSDVCSSDLERVRQTGVDEHPAQRPAKQTLLDQPAQVPVGQDVGERLAAGEWKVTGEGGPVRERLIEMKLHTRTEPWTDSESNGGCRRQWLGASTRGQKVTGRRASGEV